MPIYEFGEQNTNKEDTPKIENKPKPISGPESESEIREPTQIKKEKTCTPKIEKESKPVKTEKSNHPLVCGLLEIEEEEL